MENKYPNYVKIKDKIWFLSKSAIAITLRFQPFINAIYIRKYHSNGKPLSDYSIKHIINHENIHWKQQAELPYIFYIIYILEWLIKIPFYMSFHKAYRNISFEREAYYFQDNSEKYLQIRKPYAWLKYIFKDPFK